MSSTDLEKNETNQILPPTCPPPPKKTPKLGDFFKGKRIFFSTRCKRLRFFCSNLSNRREVAILKESAFIKLISVLVTLRVVSKPKFRYCRYPRNSAHSTKVGALQQNFDVNFRKTERTKFEAELRSHFFAHYFSFCFKSFGILTVNLF